MGSSRLPGKVLKPLCGKPMLAWILERLRLSTESPRLIVATSILSDEEPIIALCAALGVEVYRGSETDVLDRYYRCARDLGLDPVIRATGDNPFVDSEECDRLIRLREEKNLDYASAFSEFGSGLPLGVGLEVFTFAALERSWREAKTPRQREHVNEYMQENPGSFHLGVLEAPPHKRAANLSLTVDTPEEFAAAERLYSKYLGEAGAGPVPVEWAIAALRAGR